MYVRSAARLSLAEKANERIILQQQQEEGEQEEEQEHKEEEEAADTAPHSDLFLICPEREKFCPQKEKFCPGKEKFFLEGEKSDGCSTESSGWMGWDGPPGISG